MILAARARGNHERIVALAHQTEWMARQDPLKPLADYFRRSAPAQAQNQNAAVIAKFTSIARKGGVVTITRIQRAKD